MWRILIGWAHYHCIVVSLNISAEDIALHVAPVSNWAVTVGVVSSNVGRSTFNNRDRIVQFITIFWNSRLSFTWLVYFVDWFTGTLLLFVAFQSEVALFITLVTCLTWSCGFSSIERVVITTKLAQALCICFSWVVTISCVSMATTTHPFCFSLPELRFSAAAWTVLEGSPTASLNCCLWTLNDSPARRASTGLAKLGTRRSLVLESRWSITKLSGLSFHYSLNCGYVYKLLHATFSMPCLPWNVFTEETVLQI